MAEIEELIKRIEELRENMIKVKEGRSYTDPKVIASSQALDDVLDKYQEMLLITHISCPLVPFDR